MYKNSIYFRLLNTCNNEIVPQRIKLCVKVNHTLEDKLYQRVVNNVKSCRGADINLDHFVVRVDGRITKKLRGRWRDI